MKRGALGTEVAKHVVVLASGETERRALPHLVRHLAEQGVVVDSIFIDALLNGDRIVAS